MLDRNYIEHVLKVNGLTATAQDEEIRSVLISAKWDDNDVETALTVLRENMTTHENRVDTLHNVFMTDQRLSPEAIESLLGIQVDITPSELRTLRDNRSKLAFWQILVVFILSTILASGSIVFAMYLQNVGPFHTYNEHLF